MEEKIINIPNNDVISFIEQTQEIYNDENKISNNITFDLRNLHFINPFLLAPFTATCLYMVEQKIGRIRRIVYPQDRSLRRYLERMDFHKLLKLSSIENITRHNASDKICELMQLSSKEECSIATQKVIKIVRRQTRLNEDIISIMNFIITEIVENVFDHSGSCINGVMCAQYYPTKSEIKICIADCGIGILKSLLKNKLNVSKCASIKDALKLAVSKHGTGTDSFYRGEGLFTVTKILEKCDGFFCLYSGNGAYVKKSNIERIREVPLWGGTIVVMAINTNKTVSFEEAFKDENIEEPLF
jgi:hypothetical protein